MQRNTWKRRDIFSRPFIRLVLGEGEYQRVYLLFKNTEKRAPQQPDYIVVTGP